MCYVLCVFSVFLSVFVIAVDTLNFYAHVSNRIFFAS